LRIEGTSIVMTSPVIRPEFLPPAAGAARRLPASTSRAPVLAAALLALTLSACTHRKADVTGSVPHDYRERHPIVLAEAPRSIDIYAGGGRIDPRQADDIAAFAAEYRAQGRSHIVAQVPGGHGHHGFGAVRQALASQGVPPSSISVRSYPAPDATIAAPIKLSFAKLQARLPHECGHWPEDLGVSNYKFSASNRSYTNFGCATQHNLAAFVADPLDLERARPEGRLDTVRRMNAVAKLRMGQDPSTTYRDAASRINTTVGN
jgi:pilus assembly protein CpaD